MGRLDMEVGPAFLTSVTDLPACPPARDWCNLQFNLMACIEDRRQKYGSDLAQQLHLQASRRFARIAIRLAGMRQNLEVEAKASPVLSNWPAGAHPCKAGQG